MNVEIFLKSQIKLIPNSFSVYAVEAISVRLFYKIVLRTNRSIHVFAL